MSEQAVPRMLVANNEQDVLMTENSQASVMFYSGYMGWSLYGALAVFNSLYYFDIYKRQYMDNIHGMSSWDKMAFRSLMGAASFIRLHISMVGWFLMSVFWAISMGGWTFPVLHTFFYGFVEVWMAIWVVRILILLIM